MRFLYRTSPNQNARIPGAVVNAIVLHATADQGDPEGALDWVEAVQSQVSYHAIIERDGTVDLIVPPDRKAWHAGVSVLDGVADVNEFSLGLAFANKNDGETYTPEQLNSAASLIASWMLSYPKITYDRIVTHAAIAIPKGRKDDPFDFDLSGFVSLVRLRTSTGGTT